MQNVINAAKEKMEKSMDALERELGTIRAGRANPKVLDRISVDYYGTPTPINQMAAVSVPDPKTILIQPWDSSQLKAIEQAIQASDIGINPQNDGRAIRLNFPQPTEERRKELVKEAKKVGEDSKVAVRSIRRDAIEEFKKMKKDGEMTEDEQKASEKAIQDLTDKFTKEIDAVTSKKESEIMKI